MPLQPLQIVKNWFTNTRTREENWDELQRNILAYATRTNNNLKQIGLDIYGVNYNFNNIGQSTINPSIVAQLNLLNQTTSNVAGFVNLGLDLTNPAKIRVVAADGTTLSATNLGKVSFNSTDDPGEVVTRNLSSSPEVTLTGAHWGQNTFGDLTDYLLWIFLVDTGSDVILCVSAQAGRTSVLAADCTVVPTSVNSLEKVLTNVAVSSSMNIAYLGWVVANFDDTGNPLGEDYWEVQSGIGDINLRVVTPINYGALNF